MILTKQYIRKLIAEELEKEAGSFRKNLKRLGAGLGLAAGFAAGARPAAEYVDNHQQQVQQSKKQYDQLVKKIMSGTFGDAISLYEKLYADQIGFVNRYVSVHGAEGAAGKLAGHIIDGDIEIQGNKLVRVK